MSATPCALCGGGGIVRVFFVVVGRVPVPHATGYDALCPCESDRREAVRRGDTRVRP